ncbi:hypothetical protein SMSP2_01747 [Limihaloglobus sulfuriphilus]|uniref:Uncharacterized protein n=1 Tax=Limihaloglobus sulfuriphilus TaxID=1851148 RepID=A0A1Q2MFE8_9BACT|nr:hypothetical protein [Limihaloglobus sulfuriphilus]AQQ71374.1 hypothetical protein SMSP2_01747 [Limihaloglobus sulfuriphilus]
MKLLFSLIIAIGLVVCIILAVEGAFSTWQMIVGFIICFPLSFIGTQWRRPITIFPIAIIAMLILYFGIEHAWHGLIPGGILGTLLTVLISIGWINPHEPFSRKDYIEKITTTRIEEE